MKESKETILLNQLCTGYYRKYQFIAYIRSTELKLNLLKSSILIKSSVPGTTNLRLQYNCRTASRLTDSPRGKLQLHGEVGERYIL